MSFHHLIMLIFEVSVPRHWRRGGCRCKAPPAPDGSSEPDTPQGTAEPLGQAGGTSLKVHLRKGKNTVWEFRGRVLTKKV